MSRYKIQFSETQLESHESLQAELFDDALQEWYGEILAELSIDRSIPIDFVSFHPNPCTRRTHIQAIEDILSNRAIF